MKAVAIRNNATLAGGSMTVVEVFNLVTGDDLVEIDVIVTGRYRALSNESLAALVGAERADCMSVRSHRYRLYFNPDAEVVSAR